MFGDGSLTFQEFATRERVPLARVHDAVLEFLRGRADAVLCGAHAVNAYVTEPRMTQDVDIVSMRSKLLVEELCKHLRLRFRIAARVLNGAADAGYRIDQRRRPVNRHLVDVRPVSELPPAKRVKKVLVVTPPELIANKVMSMVDRRRQSKRFLDQADLYRLLLGFPTLKTEEGPVAERLHAASASQAVLAAWKDLAAQEILPEDDDAEFSWWHRNLAD